MRNSGGQILAEHAQLESLLDEQCRRRLAAGLETGKGLDWAYLLEEGGWRRALQCVHQGLGGSWFAELGILP